ncbi:pilin [Candidatus Saccharibacteria bacterium]|nr:pilin [Candidatus Saccharibacteria bacterium]
MSDFKQNLKSQTKNRWLRFLGCVVVMAAVVSVVLTSPVSAADECVGILPSDWCGENGVWRILELILNIMTMGIGILALVGIVISGIQWMTARDKEEQIVKAKSRIFNIVIGLIVWALIWLILNWLIPGFTIQA